MKQANKVNDSASAKSMKSADPNGPALQGGKVDDDSKPVANPDVSAGVIPCGPATDRRAAPRKPARRVPWWQFDPSADAESTEPRTYPPLTPDEVQEYVRLFEADLADEHRVTPRLSKAQSKRLLDLAVRIRINNQPSN